MLTKNLEIQNVEPMRGIQNLFIYIDSLKTLYSWVISITGYDSEHEIFNVVLRCNKGFNYLLKIFPALVLSI